MDELTPGMIGIFDQMDSSWGQYANAVGYFYHQLLKWNIREEYAIQMAARFQGHLEILLETEAAEAAIEKALAQNQAKQKTTAQATENY